MTTKVSALLGGAALVAMTVSSANAASVSDLLFPGTQLLSDNSAEYLINGPRSTGDTIVDVGDRLRGIFNIETVEQAGSTTRNLGGSSGNQELSGIFDLVVTSKTSLGGPHNQYQFTFAPSGALSAYGGAGVAAAFFVDNNPEYTRLNVPGCTTIACMEARVTNGSLYWSVGMSDPTNNFWNAVSRGDDISIAKVTPFPASFGQFDAGVNFIVNNSGSLFNQVQCLDQRTFTIRIVNMCAQGNLVGIGNGQGGTLDTPFDSFDDVNFTINRVPEPATIGLMGLGLLGVAAAARRRKGKG